MFQVEPASILAPFARRLRHTAVLLCQAAQHRGEESTLPSLFLLDTMLGSAPRLRRRRAELVALDKQARYSGVTWPAGEERGEQFSHLFDRSI